MIRHPLRPSPPGVSLARALSKLGVATRTQAIELIAAGRVTVNGAPAHWPAQRIDMARDVLALDGEALRAPPRRYLALNKPRGLVTTARDEQGRTTVYHCLRTEDKKLVPVGRLDRASEGLLLFTNDTQWAQRILDPAHHLSKTYHVQVDRLLEPAEIARLRRGIEIGPGLTTRPAQIELLRAGGKTCWLEITLHEGLNRQIRRMIQAVGAQVLRLVRIRIGPIELGDLAKGHTRPLTVQELAALDEANSGRKPAIQAPGFPPARE
jgi:23S rRNA pseudouridine2605 synthase